MASRKAPRPPSKAPPSTTSLAASGQLLLFSDTTPASTPAAAPYAAGGFYHQLPHATLRALDLDKGQTLGVEVLDDLHIDGPNGTRLLQLKKTTSPVTDMDRGLWKALANWSTFVISGPRHDITEMLFVTTASIHGGLPDLLARKTSAEERTRYILDNIRPSKDKDLDSFITRIKSLPAGVLASLLSRVTLVREGGAAELFCQIRDKLRRHFPDDSLDRAARELQGWIVEIVTIATQENRGALVSEDKVREALLNMHNRYDSRRQSYRHGDAALDPKERASHQNSTFLRQLDAINAPDMLRNMALEDYLRQVKEEIEWATNLEVGKQDLVDYRNQVYEKWRILHADIRGRLQQSNDEEYGLAVCDDLLKSPSPRLFVDDSPPAHVFRGTCHMLANIPKIGWHRKWAVLFAASESSDGA